MKLTLTTEAFTAVEDAAGNWQFEGGRVLEDQNLVRNFPATKRFVFKGTEAQNVAILPLIIFFLGQQPPENITLQGCHDFNVGIEIGGIRAASAAFASYVGKHFSRVGDTLRIQ